MNLVDRFLHYVSFDTQSDELTHMTPSTPGQMIFAQELEKELRKIGMTEVSLDENGYLMATLPPNTSKNIPVIGLGGIMNWKDAIEFMLAGATAIQIGTANFIDPAVTIKVEDGINNYLDRYGYKSVKEIIGALEV